MLQNLGVLFAVILIVVMMVIPLPPLMLDFLLILNLTLSLTVLMVAMNTKESLQFSVFPTLLLITTLFRLGLNVSTTRAILSTGSPGQVIESFGSFVVGGNAVVGFIVFLILIIIQFLVITKGSERVAEVAARFTLDAMPGKQMSIDADLNTGLISDQEARERREKIQQEADFYGAMDGASKFVKGDAIAGIIIVLINIVGGFSIGMAMMDMSFSEALQRFTLLSVGDGLVSQIPALLISTATGIIVTRASSDNNLSQDLGKQLFSYPVLLYIVAGVILIMGLFTPIGLFRTFPVAALLCFGAWAIQRNMKSAPVELPDQAHLDEAKKSRSPDSVVQLLQVDSIEFEFGYGLIPLADAHQGGDLLDRVIMIRRQLAAEMGFILPMVRIRDNIQLKPNEYQLKLFGSPVGRGEVMPDRFLAMGGATEEELPGIPTKEPAFGMPAYWISEEVREEAEISGFTVVDPPSVIATHLTEVFKRHLHELLTRQETKALIENLKEKSPAVVEELIPQLMTVGEVQKVLAKLLKEKVSIRNLSVILESLADHATINRDSDILTEHVRQALSRQITQQYSSDELPMRVLTLAPALERRLMENIQRTEQGSHLLLEPAISQQIYQQLREQVQRVVGMGVQPILLTSPALRPHVRLLTEKWMPDIPVLSYNELEPEAEVQSLGVVNL